MLNPADMALNRRIVTYVCTVLLIAAGVLAYLNLGRLEDPTFTIKTAVVSTRYPGAAPAQVEEEVTDQVEEAIQSMGPVKEIYSTSQAGLSVVYVDMKKDVDPAELPQIWDELRHKVGDMQGGLPPGAGPSVVNDDFGDVYGLFFALTGEGYSYAQLKDYAKSLKKELLLCKDVAKIDFWGTQREVIYIEFQRARLTELGIPPRLLMQTLAAQNAVEPSGRVEVGTDYVRITPTGELTSEQSIEDLYIGGPEGLIRVGDVADVTRGYQDPPRNLMRADGKPAIGLGISVVEGGNVVDMGQAVAERIAELEGERPLGMELKPLYYQSRRVMASVRTFMVNLVQAVAIVVGLLMLFMGLQSGLLIGFILLLTILATFIGMYLMDINLQKVSLGALILALGMLVDNAIVVADGILVRVQRGTGREEAARDVVGATQWPLLGATVVAILAFGAIGFSPGKVGEFCRSLFQVMALSLSLSWVLAVTVTPLFCVKFLKVSGGDDRRDPYDRPMYRFYRRFVHACISGRYVTMAVVLALLVLAVLGFGRIPRSFFPSSTQPYFFVNTWHRQGTSIHSTAADTERLAAAVEKIEGVRHVSAFIGEGTLRFILNYNYQIPNGSYAQLLVEMEDYRGIDDAIYNVERLVRSRFPGIEAHCEPFMIGPTTEYAIEARFRGDDIAGLKRIAARAEGVMWDTGGARNVRTNWRTSTLTIRPEFAESRARRVGASRSDLAGWLQWSYSGKPVGLYREDDTLIPILSRPVPRDRLTAAEMADEQVWASLTKRYLPFRQVADGVRLVLEDPLIQRRDRQRTVTVQCNPVTGLPESLRQQMVPAIEDIELPPGIVMEWGGEYESSREAQAPLQRTFPLFLVAMFVILVVLFNSLRNPAIILLVVPLAVIGVVGGLLLTGRPFGFMAILGLLGLSGMLIKNAIVLIDQINLELAGGAPPYRAILDSAVSRLRPVTMAAGTTILGMTPLVPDPLYASMAVTIMGGLIVATFLTLVVVPVLYSLFFRIPAGRSSL